MRHFQRLTVQNTPIFMSILLACRAIGAVIGFINPMVFYYYLSFDPDLILRGQVWRLFTYVFHPMGGSSILNLILAALMIFIYFSISRNLIAVIGKLKFDMFLAIGLTVNVVIGFLYYFILGSIPSLQSFAYNVVYLNPSYTYYMLFILFSMIYPDVTFYIYFIIPIRGKYMVFIALGLFLLEVVQAFFLTGADYAWFLIAMIIAAILSMLLFLLIAKVKTPNRTERKRTKKVVEGRFREMKDPAMKLRPTGTRHRCTVCGRTEETNPELEFRYCSKCVGNYEYCSDHLYTHLHKFPNVTDGGDQS
ncbi:MAG: hypothetical protein IK088_02535 [Lachnospiraceae bacterium]|nr:hypothetical protein [Lachnospiraceae bacterium]